MAGGLKLVFDRQCDRLHGLPAWFFSLILLEYKF